MGGGEVWGGVETSQKRAWPVDLRDQSAQGRHCTDRQNEAWQGVGTGQVTWRGRQVINPLLRAVSWATPAGSG